MDGTNPSSTRAEELDHEEIEKLVLSLPKEKGWAPDALSKYQNFWFPTRVVPKIISFQRHFQALDQDIILASQPKSGTTWLKALIFSIVNRTRFRISNSPLLDSNPHELIPFIEFNMYAKNRLPNHINMPSPRLFSTHIPYQSLPKSIQCSKCVIVYICRNPFDTMVSSWHFCSSVMVSDRLQRSMEEHFDMFSRGVHEFGPFIDHVLGYWKMSLEKPHKVLFLKYEDVKGDTKSCVKKLAKFIGSPFSIEEENEGVIDEIIRVCSFEGLRDLDVNKNGKWSPYFENKSYFRKGEVGDWVNHLNPSTVKDLEKAMNDRLSGTGLTFNVSK